MRTGRAGSMTRCPAASIVAATALAAAMAAAGCTSPDPEVTARESSSLPVVAPVEWTDCDDSEVLDPELECATLTVPLDYADPAGDTLDLAVIRLPASRSRVGAVITNPGGPGASGFDFIAYNATYLRDDMGLQRFDIVGFDPRGVDRSGGLRCLTDAEVDASMYLDYSPDTPAEEALLDAAPADFATECTDEYGDTLRHYSTENTARDIDAIRVALGDDQISYLGISYGTYLGGVYATLFPDRVRAMVLDAAFDPVGDTVEEQYSTQLVGFENAFDNWATWCENTPGECAFSSEDVGAAWDALYDRLDAQPVEAADGRFANEAVMDTATTSALYSEYAWPTLGTALDAVSNGDPATLFRLADSYVGRADDGTYSTEQQSFAIISCASGFSAATPDDAEALADDLREKAPRFGDEISAEDLTGDDECDTIAPDANAVEIAFTGDAPVLVVGGENDPATPIRWAEEMTASMGPAARLLTYTGEGHGFVLISSCVTDFEAAVLVSLDLPDAGTSCDPDPDIEQPSWWTSLPLPSGISVWRSDPAVLAALGLPPTLGYAQIAYTVLPASQVLDTFDTAMDAAGLESLGRQQPIEGIDQAIYGVDDEIVSILVVEPADLDLPDLTGLDGLVAPGQTLVIQVYFPQ